LVNRLQELFGSPNTEYPGWMCAINTHQYSVLEQQHTRRYPMSASARLFALVLLLASLAIGTPAIATPDANDARTIQYLLGYVRQSNLTFRRNFSSHTSEEAASHIQEKYHHFRDEIASPEDFIDMCASKSLMTGRYYLIIDEQGHETRTRDWLMKALNNYRNERNPTSTK